jgi:hypothetical protein
MPSKIKEFLRHLEQIAADKLSTSTDKVLGAAESSSDATDKLMGAEKSSDAFRQGLQDSIRVDPAVAAEHRAKAKADHCEESYDEGRNKGAEMDGNLDGMKAHVRAEYDGPYLRDTMAQEQAEENARRTKAMDLGFGQAYEKGFEQGLDRQHLAVDPAAAGEHRAKVRDAYNQGLRDGITVDLAVAAKHRSKAKADHCENWYDEGGKIAAEIEGKLDGVKAKVRAQDASPLLHDEDAKAQAEETARRARAKALGFGRAYEKGFEEGRR